MSRVRIVTDSTSDVPPEIADRLDITVVPAYVQIGNNSYRDGPMPGGLSREAFYAQLPGMRVVPTTSAPPIYEFAAAYRSLVGRAEEIIAIVAPANLSSIHNIAHLGAQEVPELKVHVVDSGQLSMGLGWMTVAAAEAAAQGQTAQEILALIENMKPRTHVYAMLDTLEYMRRSGRVSWARARAAQILNIKPLVGILVGKVQDMGRARTRRRAIDHLVELARALGPLERLAVLHTYAPELEAFQKHLAALFAPKELVTVAVTTILGAHVGPRGLGLAAVVAQ